MIRRIVEANYTISQPNSTAYWAGRCVGDLATLFGGEIITMIGLTEGVAGLGVSATGIGALFGGVALTAAGVITVSAGVSTMVVSAGNLFNNTQNLINAAKSNGNTSSGGKYVPKTGDWRPTGRTVLWDV